MKAVNSFTSSTSSFNASTLSLPSLALAQSTIPGDGDSVFEDLVSKLFCCRILLVPTEHAQTFTNRYFDDIPLAEILNQLSQLTNLHSVIRDLNVGNAYPFNKVRYRFFDVDHFKSRMSESQTRKSQLEIVGSKLSKMQETCNLTGENNLTTPWYAEWRNHYIDTYEKSEHDFIGSSCGCFFVITKQELPHYKTIFEKLCASVKQMSSVSFIQSDFVRFFIVLTDEELAPSSEYGRFFQNLQGDFSNSFALYIGPNIATIVESQRKSSHAMFTLGDDEMLTTNSGEETGNSGPSSNSAVASDPLNSSGTQNSSFYNQLVSQRSQAQSQMTGSRQEKNDETLAQTSDPSPMQTKTIDSNLLFSLSQALSEPIENLLREFTIKSLVSWAERQIKFLGDAISQRKSLRKSFFNATKTILNMSSSSLSKAITGSGAQSGVFYVPDAQEMQQRKLADICMMFGLYEMAAALYYSARKDFQSENAWIYFAGASEMHAIASYFLKKFNPNYLDQAINTYLETCKNIKLATRIVILATELNCQMGRYNEAANMFIRLTGDDSDLRSALFLEQASKCFLLASRSQDLMQIPPNEWIGIALAKSEDGPVYHASRFRKAAFHYILAGHRFNRCGLKHFALTCYEKFNYPSWDSASDHVNLTVSRLSLLLPSAAETLAPTHYLKGLEIYRSNSHKHIFFNELLKEFKKSRNEDAKFNTDCLMKYDMNIVNFPDVHDMFFLSNDSLKSPEYSSKGKMAPKTCYVGEEIEIAFQLTNSFPISLGNLKLLCNQTDFSRSCVEVVNFEEAASTVNISLKITPSDETEFELLGMEFEIENIQFRCNFAAKFQKNLIFKAIRSLPLIPVEISFPEFGLDHVALKSEAVFVDLKADALHVPVKMYASEKFNIQVHCNLGRCGEWRPASMKMFSDIRPCYSWPEIDNNPIDANEDLYSEDCAVDVSEKKEHLVLHPLDQGPFVYQAHIPPRVSRHSVSFRLVYTDQDGESREIQRKVIFNVVSCLTVEMRLDEVITVKNLFQDQPLSFYDVSIGDEESNKPDDSYSVSIPVNQLAHLLLLKKSLRWSVFDAGLATQRNGLVAFG